MAAIFSCTILGPFCIDATGAISCSQLNIGSIGLLECLHAAPGQRRVYGVRQKSPSRVFRAYFVVLDRSGQRQRQVHGVLAACLPRWCIRSRIYSPMSPSSPLTAQTSPAITLHTLVTCLNPFLPDYRRYRAGANDCRTRRVLRPPPSSRPSSNQDHHFVKRLSLSKENFP